MTIAPHITRPLTAGQAYEVLATSNSNRLRCVVEVAMFDIVNADLEGLLDILSEKAVGNSLLMDIGYQIVGRSAGGECLIEVTGDPSEAFSEEFSRFEEDGCFKQFSLGFAQIAFVSAAISYALANLDDLNEALGTEYNETDVLLLSKQLSGDSPG